MYPPPSRRFLPALAESHTPVSMVELFRTDGRVEELEHTGGQVTADRGSAVRRTCTVTLADTALLPRSPRDRLTVYGSRLRVRRGIRFPDGTVETVPLGLFRLDSAEGDVDTGPVTLQGKSLECVVADDKFTSPYKASGTAVGAVTALIQRSLPSTAVVSRVTDAAIGPRVFDIEADAWAAAQECAAAVGAEVYADADGQFVLDELPDVQSTPAVWEIAAGEGGAYIKADRGLSADKVYNAVLARGENSEADTPPVSALVVDSDPTSPTFWDGPYGHRPHFHSSSTLTTVSRCTAAATLLLRSAVAPNASADLTSLPNPCLEPGDVVRVVYPDGSREVHQVQAFTVSLEAGGEFVVSTVAAKEDG